MHTTIQKLARRVFTISSTHEENVKSWDDPALLHCTVFGASHNIKRDKEHKRNDMLDAEFDQLILRDEELPACIIGVFRELELLQDLGISEDALDRLVRATAARYQLQPYHNFRHAFDVFQAAYLLLVRSGQVKFASKVEQFTLLVTALLHDVGHVGLTNGFHEKGNTAAYSWPYSLLSKTHPELDDEEQQNNESMHIFAARELLFGQDGLISAHDKDLRETVDTTMVALIRASDTLTLSAFLSSVDARIGELSGPLGRSNDPADRLKVLSLIIRLADIYHPMRPFYLHKMWAVSIAQEFALQGKVEQELGQETSPMTDTSTYVSSLGKSTIGFIDFLVAPLLQRALQAMPELPTDLASSLGSSRLKWSTYDLMVRSRKTSNEDMKALGASENNKAGKQKDAEPAEMQGKTPVECPQDGLCAVSMYQTL